MSGTTPTGDDEPRRDSSTAPAAGSGSTPDLAPPNDAPAADAPLGTDAPASSPYTPAAAEPPKPIITAVRLIWAGAALQVVTGLSTLMSRDSLREGLVEANPDLATPLTPTQIDASVDFYVAGTVFLAVVATILWLWMASANKRGRSWARITSTVLGGLNIVTTLWILTGGGGVSGGLNVVFTLIPVVIAAAVLYLLYRPESAAYYSAVSQTRRRGPR